ncbi:MAG: chorismate dehydratase, partial [Abditibacteriota bacterium]|nr:chorismate dehydratase [Abditibacteriota bacterium]
LNALPLYKSLAARSDINIISAVPSQLGSLLEARQCDTTLLPVADWFDRNDWQIVSDACIGCDGAVRSVLLLAQKPLDQIRRIALDTSSHTSVALLKVLCADHFGIVPQFVDHAPDLEGMLQECDAALLIGDSALQAYAQSAQHGLTIYDLGTEWKKHTDLPFVFATWIARRDLGAGRIAELHALLQEARDVGMTQRSQLAQNAATEVLPAPLIESYFSSAILYTLTPGHRAGLQAFGEKCAAHGLTTNATTRR